MVRIKMLNTFQYSFDKSKETCHNMVVPTLIANHLFIIHRVLILQLFHLNKSLRAY